MRRVARTLWLAMAVALCPGAASADDQKSYQSLWDAVANSPDCSQKDDVDLVIVTCEKSESLWYFTKPGHPAHPGVIQRAVVQIADGVGIHEEGWSFASDAAQPAFKTFLAQIRALDQQMKEAMAAGGNPPRAPATIAVGGNWRPQGTETEAVISLSKYYYGLEFGSRIEDAYALADSSLRATLPFDRYSNFANDVLLKAGRLKDFTVKDIDWEKDPPQGPPGLYAAVDFSAEAEKGHLCGYLAWKRADDGFFTLVREETNIMDSSMSSDNVAKAKAQFRCAP